MKKVVKSLIFDGDSNVLVLVRSNTHPNYANEDDLPGGELEHSESEIESVVREIHEETGLEVRTELMEKVYEKIVNQDTLHILFVCKVDATEPMIKLSWEHSSYSWRKIDQNHELKSQDDYISTVNEWLTSYSVVT